MYGLVAVVAAAAAAVAVAGALVQERAGEERAPARGEERSQEPPPLELDVLLGRDRTARELRAAERAYERGARAEARRQFERVLRREPSSVEAAVGAAIAAWPEGTIQRLEDLVADNPDSGVARLHLGFALLAAGRRDEAVREWREAERRDPDSPAALTAEDVLHPGMPPGRPHFVPTASVPPALVTVPAERQLADLARRARRGGAPEWILYGAALQRAGRPVSALRAFERAAALAPGSVEAKAAVAVGRFDEDDPSQAFSRLGPLAAASPRSPVVRFHLGLLLLWLRDADEAKEQLRRAREAGPETLHGRTAARLLRRLRAL